jgi:prepilin-type N-terminal cleavage/methylation domain-containing protein
MRRRHGFSILELLVAISVIGVLVSLLLPSIQQARESARRAQCASNLKQIGIALYQYHEAAGCFPMGITGRTLPPNTPNPEGGCWEMPPHPFLLPYLEANDVYSAINFDVDNCLYEIADNAWPRANTTAFIRRIAGFLCPADGLEVPQGTNYAANAGTSWEAWHRTDGVFHVISQVRVGDILDGTSQTAFFSEHAVRAQPDFDPRTQESRFRGGWLRLSDTIAQEEAQNWCRAAPSADAMPLFFFGMWWTWRHCDYRHVLTPNHRFCVFSAEDQPTIYGMGPTLRYLNPPTSFHPSGVHTLMGDGSLQFTSETIDPDVWRAIGSRSGGEIVAGRPLN